MFPNLPIKQNTEPTIPPLLRPQTDKFVRKFGVIISEPDSYNHHRVHPFLESVLINIANEIKIELRITETNNFNFKCERFGDSSPSLTFQGHPNWTRTRSKKSYHEIKLASKWGNYTSDTKLMIKTTTWRLIIAT